MCKKISPNSSKNEITDKLIFTDHVYRFRCVKKITDVSLLVLHSNT